MSEPYYQQDGITIYCQDNVEAMSSLDPDSIDLVVTSPPYDNLRTYGGHTWDFEQVALQLWRIIKPGGVVVWVVADQTIDGSESGESFRQALRFKEIGFRLHDTMIWNKPPTGAAGSCYAYEQSHEYMFVLTSGRPNVCNRIRDRKNAYPGWKYRKTTGGRNVKNNAAKPSGKGIVPQMGLRTNVWTLQTAKTWGDTTRHPAMFPEGLARDHILSWSNEGDTVLDCFNGSGTTTKMAKHMGRRGIGIEIEPSYCEIAVNRLRQGVLDFGETALDTAKESD